MVRSLIWEESPGGGHGNHSVILAQRMHIDKRSLAGCILLSHKETRLKQLNTCTLTISFHHFTGGSRQCNQGKLNQGFHIRWMKQYCLCSQLTWFHMQKITKKRNQRKKRREKEKKKKRKDCTRSNKLILSRLQDSIVFQNISNTI